MIPYAPFFRELPLVDGRVADTWMWSSMIWPVAVSGVTFVVFAFLLARARERAVRVEQLGALLKQMFGRYVSTEVVKSLLARPRGFQLGGERRRVAARSSRRVATGPSQFPRDVRARSIVQTVSDQCATR